MISTAEPAVAPAQDDVKPADVPDATSQPNPPSSPAQQFVIDAGAKDRRAYEVARQRVKHAQEWCRARERKAAKRGGPGVININDSNGRRSRGVQVPVDMNVEAKDVGVLGVLGVAREVPVSPGQTCGVESPSRVDAREVAPTVTVRLEDLVRVAKVRSDKAGDFELIPHVRAVLALDDSEFVSDAESGNHKMVPDFDYEGWEHVDSCSGSGTSSSDEDEPRKAPSYAQVVSSAKH